MNNHGSKRRRVGRPAGPTKIYWAIRLTSRQRNEIQRAAKLHRTPYGAFIYECVRLANSK